MYSVHAVADVLGLSDNTVRRMIAAGKIGAITLGPRSTRIPREELARLVSPYVVEVFTADLKAGTCQTTGKPE